MKRLFLSISLIACALVPALACSRPQPGFSREDAIKRATESAAQSAPEVSILEVRIDSVAAELITLGEADRRMGGERGTAGCGPGQSQDTLVWWVRVQGYFRFESMPAPDAEPPIYAAPERIFVYDAHNGKELGSRMPYTSRGRRRRPGAHSHTGREAQPRAGRRGRIRNRSLAPGRDRPRPGTAAAHAG